MDKHIRTHKQVGKSLFIYATNTIKTLLVPKCNKSFTQNGTMKSESTVDWGELSLKTSGKLYLIQNTTWIDTTSCVIKKEDTSVHIVDSCEHSSNKWENIS